MIVELWRLGCGDWITGINDFSYTEFSGYTRNETITSKSFFVVLVELYTIRIYSFTEELDPKRHALIKSEVWLALGELMEELDIIQRTSEDSNRMSTSWIDDDTPLTLDIAGLRP